MLWHRTPGPSNGKEQHNALHFVFYSFKFNGRHFERRTPTGCRSKGLVLRFVFLEPRPLCPGPEEEVNILVLCSGQCKAASAEMTEPLPSPPTAPVLSLSPNCNPPGLLAIPQTHHVCSYLMALHFLCSLSGTLPPPPPQ